MSDSLFYKYYKVSNALLIEEHCFVEIDKLRNGYRTFYIFFLLSVHQWLISLYLVKWLIVNVTTVSNHRWINFIFEYIMISRYVYFFKLKIFIYQIMSLFLFHTVSKKQNPIILSIYELCIK